MPFIEKWLLNILKDDVPDKYFREVYAEPRTEPVTDVRPTISIVTTAMDRLSDIIQTLPANMDDNPEAEFILVDYNSKDGLAGWIKNNMMTEILTGRLKFYRTTEPTYYSMAHSRNIGFSLATGDIVNNVDADHFTNPGFARRIQDLAMIYPESVIFVKSRQKKRGRIGLRKHDFIKLGGYNEQLIEYGFDDQDLIYRATIQDYKMVIFGGEYYRGVEDHGRHTDKNYQYEWRYTERLNTLTSLLNIAMGKWEANKGKHWGKARLQKNFEEWIEI